MLPVPKAMIGRTILALGEAKAGRRFDARHLARLTAARAALGPRAANAKLLAFAGTFTTEVRTVARGRSDVELIDLEPLYQEDQGSDR